MPAKSEAQRKAMAAAAKGKSTIGIPAKVGREYMAEDKGGKLPSRLGASLDKAIKRRKK